MLSVSQQLQLKFKLERSFKPDIRSVFNSMLQDFRIAVSKFGQPLASDTYSSSWEAILDKHYRKVQKAFTDVGIQKSLIKQPEDEDDIDEELFILALMTYRDQMVKKQTQFIVNTNINQMRDAVRIARLEAVREGITLTDTELARNATAILKRKFKPRVNSIAMQETETPAEATKFIDAESQSGLRPSVVGGGGVATQTQKSWRNAGDSRVRTGQFDHVTPEGQTVNLLDPFIVSGEQLMFPKDTSLGASQGNVQGCRCISIYVL